MLSAISYLGLNCAKKYLFKLRVKLADICFFELQIYCPKKVIYGTISFPNIKN